MRSKLGFLIIKSLKRKITTKWFLVANILLAIVIIGLININSVITFFGGDFNDKQKVYIIDNTSETYELFQTTLEETTSYLYGEETIYEIEKYDGTVEEVKALLETKEEQKNLALVFNSSKENIVEFELISKEYLDLVDTQLLTTALNNTKTAMAIQKTNISEEELNKIYSPAVVVRTFLDEDKNNAEENTEMIMTTVFPIIILPFFMLTVFLIQMIGAEVNDEKTTRGMEIIISSVSPKTHFFSKIIAGNLFVLIQGTILLAAGGIGLLLKNILGASSITDGIGGEVTSFINNILSLEVLGNMAVVLGLTFVLMLLVFLGYSLLAGILASMTTNTEDFQQMQAPLVIILLVGYYLSMMAGLFEGAIFIKILAFVPLLSAILAPSLLILGQISVVEVIISIVIMILFDYLLVKYGLRIYKVGILNYSSKDLWKKVFKAIKAS